MNLLAKTAMVISWLFYAMTFCGLWIGQLFGWHNEIWDMYDFPYQPTSPPTWAMLIGLAVTVGALTGLFIAYRSVWRILNGGTTQDFRDLARHLKQVAIGLLGFWLGYNLLTGAVQYLIVIGIDTTDEFDFSWAPLDLDIVFAIIAVALFAISKTLERAWLAEDETKHFL